MGRNHDEEKGLITAQLSTSQIPRSPLDKTPEWIRPYLELIRFEKVGISFIKPNSNLDTFQRGLFLCFGHLVGTSLYLRLLRLTHYPHLAWGLTMAAYRMHLPLDRYADKLLDCLIGAFLLRGSACTVNDIFDRHVDVGVERTRNRPLPSGRMTVSAAIVFLCMQYAVGITFFYLTVERIAFAIYPLLKRCTYWPQAWLGFAMNFGFVTAWLAITGMADIPLLCKNLPSPAICSLTLHLEAGRCYTVWPILVERLFRSGIHRHTIYACQDIEDDVKMGIRSTAILFGKWIRPLLVGCGLAFISLLVIAGVLNKQGLAYFVLAVGGTTGHLLWQYLTVDLSSPPSCWGKSGNVSLAHRTLMAPSENFNRNGQLGWIIWTGLMLDYLQIVWIL
ncbi:hypothetical protein CVT26_005687 [Gymnopilus dilepis]|uniref:4-hydroxybenzoate polyprenyltransferase, mitochondrial n=1 Tax=Gymnopilus dilepis TaxID=231916 RepID=A0A409XZX2_9AGAR|nr:hypothetical protein CVT26_005687 [Gymnopilus dilepis]